MAPSLRVHSLVAAVSLLGHCAVAQAPADAALRNALLAQVVGFGGCQNLSSVQRRTNPFFPGVQFVQGTCVLEHGQIAQPLAAVDSAGLIYVLDSESAFQFLAREHPPVGLDSTSAVAYAHDALVMQGQLPSSAQLLTDRRQAPSALCQKTGLVCSGLFLTHAERGGELVFITAFTQDAIYSAGPVFVHLADGFVHGVVRHSFAGEATH